MTVDCGADGGFARRVLAELNARDVFVRMPGVPPLDRCIRITAGTEADLGVLADAAEELEETARLFLLLRHQRTTPLTHDQVTDLNRRFPT